ncbi:MAG: hypothetical protein ISS36_02690 [Candidatus Aenigmarchaeota archaeon]|nr:hypothetical protein [Candidatus Aenigmarchaeota archaeon]
MKDQHFMVDEKILNKIVSVANLKGDETVLEIGAGTGLLTEKLSSEASTVIAVEIDKKFKKDLENIENVKVVIGNGLEKMKRLKFDKIVANIPYSITEALVQELLFHDFEIAILTVPKRFYYKLKGDSKLAIFTELFFVVEFIEIVPKTSFQPIPKTNSFIIKIVPKKLTSEKEKILKELFLQRDKKLKNALLEALCRVKKLTKNQAREDLKALKTNIILGKKLSNLNARELKFLVKSIKF